MELTLLGDHWPAPQMTGACTVHLLAPELQRQQPQPLPAVWWDHDLGKLVGPCKGRRGLMGLKSQSQGWNHGVAWMTLDFRYHGWLATLFTHPLDFDSVNAGPGHRQLAWPGTYRRILSGLPSTKPSPLTCYPSRQPNTQSNLEGLHCKMAGGLHRRPVEGPQKPLLPARA